MNPRSAVETAIATHYIAGLHFWTRHIDNWTAVICQNSHGAIEYRIDTNGNGLTVIHAPQRITGWAELAYTACPVQGGRCFEGHSGHAFRELILPILDEGNFPRVLDKLAEMHGGYFRSGMAA